MGHPVPPGWTQPSNWPAGEYEDLRDAVLFLYDGVCQKCGKASRYCTRIDSEKEKIPENLIALCRTCTGGKSFWTPKDVANLSKIAGNNAETIRKMTGFGLETLRSRPVPPQKRKKSPHRPRKTTKQSIRVVFRITPEEDERVSKHRKNFHRNSYARNRFLSKQNESAYAKMPLDSIASRLKDAEFDTSFELTSRRKTLRGLLKKLQKSNDATLIKELAAELDGCFAAIATLKSITQESVSELNRLTSSI
jgi:hypothetical protein